MTNVLCRDVYPNDTYTCSQTLPFVSLLDIGLPEDEYLVVPVLQLVVFVSELNKAFPNILTVSNLFSCNSHPLSGKFRRWEKCACFQQGEHLFKALLSACWSVTCMPSYPCLKRTFLTFDWDFEDYSSLCCFDRLSLLKWLFGTCIWYINHRCARSHLFNSYCTEVSLASTLCIPLYTTGCFISMMLSSSAKVYQIIIWSCNIWVWEQHVIYPTTGVTHRYQKLSRRIRYFRSLGLTNCSRLPPF